jgi:hypothetical protein
LELKSCKGLGFTLAIVGQSEQWSNSHQHAICSNSSANSYPNNKSAWILSTFCSWILTCFCCMSQWRNREELRS